MISLLRPRRVQASRQQGSIIIFAALGLSLAVILLAVTDMGFLYFYKREYQKAADLAAMAGARHLIAQDGTRSCEANALPAATNSAAQNLGSKSYGLAVTCGKWVPSAEEPLDLSADPAEIDAVRAVITGSPPRFMPFMGGVTISARAIALANQPLARLTIRNKLVGLDTGSSALLNPLIGGLLGGAINLGVASWEGLADASVSLLDYLDALGPLVGIDVSAGDYADLLATDVSLLTIIDASIDAVGQNQAARIALEAFRQQAVNLPLIEDVSIPVGDLIGLELANPDQQALGLELNLLDMIVAGVQIANGENAVAATLPLSIPGVGNINAYVTIIEKPQPSAIGNPNIDDISVKTAQARAYISLDLALLGVLDDVLSAIETLLGPVLNLVNDVLSLDLGQILGGLLQFLFPINCGGFLQPACPVSEVLDIQLVQEPIALAIDVGKATARVTDHNCSATEAVEKSLDVEATSAVAGLMLGKFANSNVNDTSSDFYKVSPNISPIELLKIGEMKVRPERCWGLLIGIGNCEGLQYATNAAATTWSSNKNNAYLAVKLGVRLGITNAPLLGGAAQAQVFQAPTDAELPEISGVKNPADEQIFKPVEAGSLVGSLNDTLENITLDVYKTSNQWGGVEIVTALLDGVVDLLLDGLLPILVNVLSAVLDPLLTALTQLLGVDLATAEDAANLSCDSGGATLVD